MFKLAVKSLFWCFNNQNYKKKEEKTPRLFHLAVKMFLVSPCIIYSLFSETESWNYVYHDLWLSCSSLLFFFIKLWQNIRRLCKKTWRNLWKSAELIIGYALVIAWLVCKPWLKYPWIKTIVLVYYVPIRINFECFD